PKRLFLFQETDNHHIGSLFAYGYDFLIRFRGMPVVDGSTVRKADHHRIGMDVIPGQDLGVVPPEHQRGAPWLNSERNLATVLSPLFGVLDRDMADDVSTLLHCPSSLVKRGGVVCRYPRHPIPSSSCAKAI